MLDELLQSHLYLRVLVRGRDSLKHRLLPILERCSKKVDHVYNNMPKYVIAE